MKRNATTPLGLSTVIFLLVALIETGCSPTLSNSRGSLEELCDAVLVALAQQDRDALWALLVTREEHETLLWEQLPSRNHFPFDYVRALNERNSGEAVDNALSKYGGLNFNFVSIEFTDIRPVSFWEQIQSREYGFWANVNPKVPHPRWSQATERLLGVGKRVPTQLYNGYGEYVADMYTNMSGEKLYL